MVFFPKDQVNVAATPKYVVTGWVACANGLLRVHHCLVVPGVSRHRYIERMESQGVRRGILVIESGKITTQAKKVGSGHGGLVQSGVLP